MIASLYQAAPWVYGAVLIATALAIMAGYSADHAGTRRIAIVMLLVTAIFIIVPAVSNWPQIERTLHIVVNGVAMCPLLVRPRTSRQQHIAAWFFANALVHSGFYFLVDPQDWSVIAEWFVSISIDALQAALVLWWSWPHVRKMVGRIVRRNDAAVRHPSASRAR